MIIRKGCALLAAVGLSAALSAATNEFAAAFWIRADRLPARFSPIPGAICSLDADGRLAVTLKAERKEVLGDYSFASRDRLKAGEWRHVAFNYSLMRRRASLYLDGHWQWENYDRHLPLLSRTGTVPAENCRLGDVRILDYAADSEHLTVVVREEASAALQALRRDLQGIKPPVSGLRAWIDELDGRAAALAKRNDAAEFACVTRAELRTLREAVANAQAYACVPKAALTENFAVQVTEALSQEPVLPYAIPQRGVFTDETRIFLSRVESEPVSIVVHAFKPLVVKEVGVPDLTGPGGAKLKVRDVSLVKRWIRSGGAWLSYHNDLRCRLLVPDLLLHDDALIRVDERERRNYLRLDWPTGRQYVDCSDPEKGILKWDPYLPFRDADTLQPVTIPEAGRNQQFLLTFRTEKDTEAGDYRGEIRIRTDAGEKAVRLLVKVLPIDLPEQGAPYHDDGKSFITHANAMPEAEGATYAEREAFVRTILKDVHEHGINHLSDVWVSPEHAALAREAGIIPDRIFGTRGYQARKDGGRPPFWICFYPGVDRDVLTLADRAAGIRAAVRAERRWKQAFDRDFPGSEPWTLYHSESSAWMTLGLMQSDEGEALHDIGMRLFAHGWDNNSYYAVDAQDMHATASISSDEARRWHSAGGEVINYADPFPGSENPQFFRQRAGVTMYFAGYDGHMMHGMRPIRAPWNEWAEDWSGDGVYRNFCLAYPQRGGWIRKMAFEGYREGLEDIRYYTCLRRLATKYIDAADHEVRREAKRARNWLDKTERDSTDYAMLCTPREAPDVRALRAGTAERILTLQDMIARKKGVSK